MNVPPVGEIKRKVSKQRKTQQPGERGTGISVNWGGMRGSEERVTCPRIHSKLTGGGSAGSPSEAGYSSLPPARDRVEATRGEPGGGAGPEGGERAQGEVL